MARVNTVGLTELANEIARNVSTSRTRIREMMEFGADMATDSIKLKAEEHGLRNTGKMIKSIKPGTIQIYSDSASVDIWPQGTRKNGRGRERNATVGFVQHYGRSYGKKKRPGTLFFDEGAADAADMITEGMSEIWHKGE